MTLRVKVATLVEMWAENFRNELREEGFITKDGRRIYIGGGPERVSEKHPVVRAVLKTQGFKKSGSGTFKSKGGKEVVSIKGGKWSHSTGGGRHIAHGRDVESFRAHMIPEQFARYPRSLREQGEWITKDGKRINIGEARAAAHRILNGHGWYKYGGREQDAFGHRIHNRHAIFVNKDGSWVHQETVNASPMIHRASGADSKSLNTHLLNYNWGGKVGKHGRGNR